MMVAKGMVDTNVILRADYKEVMLHNEADALIRQARKDGYQLWISRQIIREYIVQITRPGFLKVPLTPLKVESQVNALRLVFRVADETDAVTSKLIELKIYPSGGKQIHDLNIIATMLVYGIDTLLTINVEDMKRFADRVTIMPLVGEAK